MKLLSQRVNLSPKSLTMMLKYMNDAAFYRI